MNQAAAITLRREARHLRVSYRRADPGQMLRGRDAHQVLDLIPSLLPVCAGAQRIAAERAIEAASGAQETAAAHREREALLLREQALAAAWRLLVDWPRCLGLAPDLRTMKTLRSADNASLADGLDCCLSMLLDASPAVTADTAALDAIIAHLGATGAGPVLQMALEESASPRVPVTWLRGRTLQSRAADALRDAPLQRGPLPDLCGDAVAVGPLAMARHPLCDSLRDREDLPLCARLLLAMLLDTAALVHGLRSAEPPRIERETQSAEETGIGLGYACTARGPLYHRIHLDPAQRVLSWRYVAPTDWHFAAGGLVEKLGEHRDPTTASVVPIVAAADPCAAWQVDGSRGPDLREVA